MILNTQNSENKITQIDKENEVKTPEIEKENVLTPVKIHEILKQENAEEHAGDAETINVENVDKDVTKEREEGIDTAVKDLNETVNVNDNVMKVKAFCKSKKQSLFSRNLWVQTCKRNLGCGQLFYGNSGCNSEPMMCYEAGRNGFLQKVFGVLLVMISLTAMFAGSSYFMKDLKQIISDCGILFLIVGILGLLASTYAALWYEKVRMQPCNVMDLVFAVVFMSMIAAYFTVTFNTVVIFFALLATMTTVLVLLIIAFTPFDFTEAVIFLIALFTVAIALTLVIILGQLAMATKLKPATIVLIIVCALVNVTILIIEVKMIVFGRFVKIGENDYALGAFILYTSVVDILMQIVQLVGSLDKDLEIPETTECCFANKPFSRDCFSAMSFPNDCNSNKSLPLNCLSNNRYPIRLSNNRFSSNCFLNKRPTIRTIKRYVPYCASKKCNNQSNCNSCSCNQSDCNPSVCNQSDCYSSDCYPSHFYRDCCPTVCYPDDHDSTTSN